MLAIWIREYGMYAFLRLVSDSIGYYKFKFYILQDDDYKNLTKIQDSIEDMGKML